MADLIPFTPPDFIQGQDEESIYQRMKSNLPSDIDTSEGSFFWDVGRPVAIEKAELLQYHLINTLKIMHPMWSYGDWLDYHAKAVGLKRKPANSASGTLTITGIPGTIIPQGYLFATAASGDNPSIIFKANDKYVIPENGTVDIQITAVEPGTKGNVNANTVVLMVTPLQGVIGVTNKTAITGGTEVEDDDSLKERIDEVYANSNASFVGCDADYVRWAKEVPGVGAALVDPEWDGPGTVRIIVIDANGQPANSSIISAVYEHIVHPEARLQRVAPIGATVTVIAPTPKIINYSFNLQIDHGEALDIVLQRFKDTLQKYYIKAKTDNVVRYTQVSSILAQTIGVIDFTGLTLNGATANINIADDEYPVTGTIDPAGGGTS